MRLIDACAAGKTEVVAAKIAANTDVNEVFAGKTSLVVACQEGHLGIVTMLLAAGANANDDNGSTALVVACHCGLPGRRRPRQGRRGGGGAGAVAHVDGEDGGDARLP